MSSALIEFVQARLDEDDLAAQEAAQRIGPRWGVGGPRLVDDIDDFTDEEWDEEANLPKGVIGVYATDAEEAHVMRWHPLRALAEVEAKRQILRLHSCTEGHECSTLDSGGEIDHCTWVMEGEACTTLRLLALPYAEHPDFREEWRL